jgi:hypothetical protein
VTYRNAEKKQIFEVYEVDQDKHRLHLHKSCEINVDKRGPTAIMAINDRCFLVSLKEFFVSLIVTCPSWKYFRDSVAAQASLN